MFDFDSITLLIAIVSMIAFAFPFVIYSKKITKENIQKSTKLEEFIKSQQLNVTVKELWRDRYFVGMDLHQRKLVYVQNLQEFQPIVIQLDDINHVAKHEASRMLGSGKNQRKIIDELHLQLVGKSGKLKASLEIYNGEIFSDLSGEPVLIEKLENILKSHIHKFQNNR